MQISETAVGVAPLAAAAAATSGATGATTGTDTETCRFPKLEECAHFHYERVQLPALHITLQAADQSLHNHSQHGGADDDTNEWFTIQVSSADECWLVQRSLDNFRMLDAQLHQCIYDRKISQLPELHAIATLDDDAPLTHYLARLSTLMDNSVNCGPVLNWLQMDNKGHRLLVPSEESRSINTPAVAAAYSVRRYVSQARDELNLEVGDMISVIDMATPTESMWWRGKRGFQVGFFPQHCVHIIGDKVPRNMPFPAPVVGSLAITPVKPVLRKHGKLITFFRSFILNRPSRRRLKQSGILKERVFGCDLGEHLLNSGHDIPMVLRCCAEFMEKHGIVDGIYRLSGVTSNIQKLRNAFDEDRIPDLYTEEILQDIHSVASLLKMYFRELPNPLCTYQLYQSFVAAVQGCSAINRNAALTDRDRLYKMREAVQKLPPPHYRTLEYLMRHLSHVTKFAASTGMTTKNIAIVWAPNLLRCAELEVGGVAALQGVGVQAVVTEFLVCYADLIFCDRLPSLGRAHLDLPTPTTPGPKRSRPKSLAISTPTKLITLEEARSKHQLNKADEAGYIEVGGGPSNLPKKYHTVIELPGGGGARKRGMPKRSPLWLRSFFGKARTSRSQGSLNNRKVTVIDDDDDDGVVAVVGGEMRAGGALEVDLTEMKRQLRPVKSAESLTSGHSEPVSTEDILGPLHCLNKPQGHNRSVSHDSYFDMLQSSQHNSEGSLLDISEIHLNFDLEESEMRIFSEDESLVSSPRLNKESQRRILTRARPEEFTSASNSNNPSPKKQARVILSPDLSSRKRTRLEDQLSDIQYIDCSTPDGGVCVVVSTQAQVHAEPATKSGGVGAVDFYQPRNNKSPRNGDADKRQSLELTAHERPLLARSYTESHIGRPRTLLPPSPTSPFTLSPTTPLYKPLRDSTSDSQNSPIEFTYRDLDGGATTSTGAAAPTTPTYQNVGNHYENVLTTISITYRSPTRTRDDNSSPYEDVDLMLNPEQARVPTEPASLPLQQASQPDMHHHHDSTMTSLPVDLFREQRPKSLGALDDLQCQPTKETAKSSSLEMPTFSASDLSLSEVMHSPTNSQTSISFPATPTKRSATVSPFNLDTSKTLSHDILMSLSPSAASLLRTRDYNTSEGSLCHSHDYLKLTDDDDEGDGGVGDRAHAQQQQQPSPRPLSINLIDFSPDDGRGQDKRKCEAEPTVSDIYQQVKYFRRSVHEINALVQENNNSEEGVALDSLEANDVHVYENCVVASGEEEMAPQSQMPRAAPQSEMPRAAPPVVEEKKISVKSLMNHFEVKREEKGAGRARRKSGGGARAMSACSLSVGAEPAVSVLRAHHAPLTGKTRSLDEAAFARAFHRTLRPLTTATNTTPRRRTTSIDDTKLNTLPKKLNAPKAIPPTPKKVEHLHQAHSAESLPKLNRERIEKYKEERRKVLHDRYRTESFRRAVGVANSNSNGGGRDDEDALVERLKQKTGGGRSGAVKMEEEGEERTDCDTSVERARACVVKAKESVEEVRVRSGGGKESVKDKTLLFEGRGKEVAEGEELRRRHGVDGRGERHRRHTYETRDARDADDAMRRISLDSKSPRKEMKSSSYCIKDMKAIFEPKSH